MEVGGGRARAHAENHNYLIVRIWRRSKNTEYGIGAGPRKSLRFAPNFGQATHKQLMQWLSGCWHADVQRTDPEQDLVTLAMEPTYELIRLGYDLEVIRKAVNNIRSPKLNRVRLMITAELDGVIATWGKHEKPATGTLNDRLFERLKAAQLL